MKAQGNMRKKNYIKHPVQVTFSYKNEQKLSELSFFNDRLLQ